MKLYREVDSSDIPEGGEFYAAKLRRKLKILSVNADREHEPYLLPYELPTEGEIMLALVDNYGNDLATTRKTIAATKAITNLLKGE